MIRDQREAKAITGEYVDNITTLSTGKGGLTREEILKGGIQIRRGLGDAAGVETPYGESQQPDVIIPFGDVPIAPGKILGPADKTTPPVQPAQPLKP